MGISIGSDLLSATSAGISAGNVKANSLEATLKESSSSDEKLMDACKNFETYLLEQVFKNMEKTVPKSEEEENNDYMNQFGDMLYEQYAEEATKNQNIGLAQMLYDSMKRNS